MFTPCIPFRVFTYTPLIHRSPFNNFTFLFLIPTENTIFLLSISKPSHSFSLVFPVNQIFLILISVPFSFIEFSTLFPFHFQN